MAKKQSQLEMLYEHQLVEEGITGYVKEYVFHPTRKWRLDFAFPEEKLYIAIQGGVWSRGRHVRGSGFINDCEKYSSATLLGWRGLWFTGKHVQDETYLEPSTALRMTMEALDFEHNR